MGTPKTPAPSKKRKSLNMQAAVLDSPIGRINPMRRSSIGLVTSTPVVFQVSCKSVCINYLITIFSFVLFVPFRQTTMKLNEETGNVYRYCKKNLKPKELKHFH